MTDFTTALDESHQHYTLKRGHERNWLDRNMWWFGWTIFTLVIFGCFLVVAVPHPSVKQPDIVFTVQPNTQLTDYLGQGSYQRAISLAEATNRPIEMTAAGWPSSVQIAPSTARALSGETDHVRVTVKVYPGEQFVIPTNADGTLDFARAKYTAAKQ